MNLSYPKRLLSWFCRTWPVLIGIGGSVGSWIVGGLTTMDLQDQVRIAGFILQVLGLVIVALGLSETRKLFGRPSIFGQIWTWLKGFPKKGKTQTVLAGTTGATSSAGGGVRIRKGIGPDATVEQRVTALEEHVADLQKDFSSAMAQHREQLGRLTNELGNERRQRLQEQNRLREQLEEFSVGGLVLESVGFFWLLLATIFTSIPEETATAITWLLSTLR